MVTTIIIAILAGTKSSKDIRGYKAAVRLKKQNTATCGAFSLDLQSPAANRRSPQALLAFC